MESLLNKIFIDHGFNQPIKGSHVHFYEKKDAEKQEYYLIDFIEPLGLNNYIESDSTSEVFKLFDDQKKEKKDVEKNTSLIICVKVKNIKDEIGKIRNNILSIEEDDYWFKKYIIVYSDSSIPVITDIIDIKDYFNKLLLDNEVFTDYKNDIYLNEGYFLTIQLFLKLPFLNVPIQTQNNYRSIENILAQQLSEAELNFSNKLRSMVDVYSDEYWETLKINCATTNATNEIVKKFFDQFESNA